MRENVVYVIPSRNGEIGREGDSSPLDVPG